jgi:hypothetical protein
VGAMLYKVDKILELLKIIHDKSVNKPQNECFKTNREIISGQRQQNTRQ